MGRSSELGEPPSPERTNNERTKSQTHSPYLRSCGHSAQLSSANLATIWQRCRTCAWTGEEPTKKALLEVR